MVKQCDKCAAEISDDSVLHAWVGYSKTPEEVQIIISEIRSIIVNGAITDKQRLEELQASINVRKNMNLCLDCYNNFIEENF